MYLPDFIIFYMTSFYEEKHVNTLFFRNYLSRSVYLASITTGLAVLLLIQIFVLIFFKKNFILLPYAIYFVIVGIYLLNETLEHIYIKRKRFDAIKSPSFEKMFNLKISIGVYISYSFFIFFFLIDILFGVLF